MKAKSVLAHDAPEALEDALDQIDDELLNEVLVPYLKVNPDPSQFTWGDEYVQKCDFSYRPKRISPDVHICIATLTMVSGPEANGRRGWLDFPDVREAMRKLWSEKLRRFMPIGYRTRLSVVIGLDETIKQIEDGNAFKSPLVEKHGLWVLGEGDPAVCPIYVGKRSKRN